MFSFVGLFSLISVLETLKLSNFYTFYTIKLFPLAVHHHLISNSMSLLFLLVNFASLESLENSWELKNKIGKYGKHEYQIITFIQIVKDPYYFWNIINKNKIIKLVNV